MANEQYWGERVAAKVKSRLAAQEDAIATRLGRPRQRRPDTKDLLKTHLQSNDVLSGDDYRALEGYLYERYGEAARFVTPYLQQEGAAPGRGAGELGGLPGPVEEGMNGLV